MRPGHLSLQRRANGKDPRRYAQLSYTFKKQSRTDYVQPDDVDRVKAEIENYPDFPRSHPISTFPKRITDKTGANADRFAGYCLRKTGKFV